LIPRHSDFSSSRECGNKGNLSGAFMNTLNVFVIFFFIMLSVAPVHAEDSPMPKDVDAKLTLILKEGVSLMEAGNFKEAMARTDTVIAAYEDKFRDSKDTIRCARSETETLYYLLNAANKESKKNTIVLSPAWADAYYLKAYILVDAGQFVEAKPWLAKAIKLSPSNSQYLSELGAVFQHEKNWPMALQTFQSAEQAAEFSPPDAKNVDLARAWRGIAYIFVEQGRLDEAEGLYKKCLALDKNNTKATNELRYIQQVRAKQNDVD
jgi:tetratricopeptide (TPR) repeat protein